jgi:hypothetical protein
MGTGCLLDSNVIIGYLAGAIPAPGMAAVSGIVDAVPHISVISQIEILRFTDTPENEQVLVDFVNASVIHPLNDPVVHRTIALCKQSKINCLTLDNSAAPNYLGVLAKPKLHTLFCVEFRHRRNSNTILLCRIVNLLPSLKILFLLPATSVISKTSRVSNCLTPGNLHHKN